MVARSSNGCVSKARLAIVFETVKVARTFKSTPCHRAFETPKNRDHILAYKGKLDQCPRYLPVYAAFAYTHDFATDKTRATLYVSQVSFAVTTDKDFATSVGS